MLDSADNRLPGSSAYMTTDPVDETVVWYNVMHQPHADSQEELRKQLEAEGVLLAADLDQTNWGKPTSSPPSETVIQGLVDTWAGESVDVAIRRILMDLPADYDANTVADEATLTKLDDLISDMKESKDLLDTKYREELHDYRGRSLQAVPILLDVCDVLDDSRDECHERGQSISRSAARVKSSLRMVGLYRQRANWRWLKSTMDDVITWQGKFDQLLVRIDAKEYAIAASILGAKLKQVDGRYFKRVRQNDGGNIHPESPITRNHNDAWAVADGGDDDILFEDFLLGVGGGEEGTLSQLYCGKVVLAQYFELRRKGGLLIGGCIREDVVGFLRGDFSRQGLIVALRGLHALHVRNTSIADFFMEIVVAMFQGGVREAVLRAMYDEDSGIPREVSSLAPADFHGVLLAVLRRLAEMLRYMLKVSAACTSIAKEVALSPSKVGSVEETATVIEGLNCFVKQKRRIGQRVLNSAVEFSKELPLPKGNISDALHVFRLLHLFVETCRGAATDDAVDGTSGSLRFQWSSLFSEHFVQQNLEELLKLMQTEQFAPFPVGASDLTEIAPLIERDDEDTPEVMAAFGGYLKLASPGCLSDSAEEQLKLDVAPNPFDSHLYFLEPTFKPIEWAPGRSGSLFDEGYPTFTLSSFTVCKKMLDMVDGVRSLGSAAPDVCGHVHQLASVHALFIGTHFIAASEDTPLDLDDDLPPEVRAHAALIRKTAQAAVALSPHMLSGGFPYLEGAMCHQWKQAKQHEALLHGAWQRCTAIASLECVAKCHRMCSQALTGLLFESPSALHSVAEMVESITGFTRFGIRHGMRQLSNQVMPAGVITADIEKAKWDSSALQDLVESPFVQRAVQRFVRMSTQLRDQFRDSPMAAVGMLQNHCIFNIFTGFVEGVTRVKKFSEAGRSRVVTDALFLTKTLKDHHPTLSPHLIAYVMRLAHAIGGQWADVLDLVEHHRSLYTNRQLLSFGEREGFMRKRELDKVLRGHNHEDRLPVHLVEDCVL